MLFQSIYNYKKHILIDIVRLYFDLDIIFQWKYYISIEIVYPDWQLCLTVKYSKPIKNETETRISPNVVRRNSPIRRSSLNHYRNLAWWQRNKPPGFNSGHQTYGTIWRTDVLQDWHSHINIEPKRFIVEMQIDSDGFGSSCSVNLKTCSL